LASVSASGGAVDQEGTARVRHMKDVCADVAIFLAPSRHIRDRFIRFGVDPARILLSPYGFDHRPFRGPMVTSPSPPLRLGFLGSLMVSKAPHVLLEAVRRLPRGAATVDLFGAPCAYHGDDRYRSQLAPLLAQDCVRVHGPIAHEQVAEALASIDVLVVPSIWPENSPLVIQEAFLAGIPVVASRIGGIPEVVTDERNGLMFEPGSVEDLTRVLRRLLEERGLIDSLRAGVPTVRTIEDDVDFTRGVYDREKRRAVATRRRRRIAAVVLNYNTPDDTFLAVRSLLASKRRPDDIIVVDNGSTRGCRDLVEPGVVYRATEKNLGFSGGVNVGIRVALDRGADAVFLVNSDVIVAADCLEHLEGAADRRPDVGIVGPVVLARSEPGQVASIGISYDPVTGRMRHQHVGARASALRLADEWDVDAVSGCSMLIKRDVLDAIGLFDEDYFFTFEDLDFCLRARRVEFRTVLAGAARAYHEGSRSIGADSPARLYFAARNHLLLASRIERGRSIAATAFRAASIVVLNLAHAAISRSGSAPARFAAVASGTRDYVVRRFGDRSEAARATR
jgi:GT2 family glycosyltransferase